MRIACNIVCFLVSRYEQCVKILKEVLKSKVQKEVKDSGCKDKRYGIKEVKVKVVDLH